MKIYLAGAESYRNLFEAESIMGTRPICVLGSFAYVQKWMYPYIQKKWDFLLDSGAYTFLQKKEKTSKIVWLEYIKRYAEFINEMGIVNFFELDIDSIVGYNHVLELRNQLEELTNKKCIPVWHKSRGLNEFKRMIIEYDYAAIGGIVIQEIAKSEHAIFVGLLQMAKENNCKLHGLGYTNTLSLKKYPFYSVDSTAWLCGFKYGYIEMFQGGRVVKINRPNNTRCINDSCERHNIKQWLKFQEYAKENL